MQGASPIRRSKRPLAPDPRPQGREVCKGSEELLSPFAIKHANLLRLDHEVRIDLLGEFALDLHGFVERTHRGQPLEDRKSTRLNSSHVRISYAVFCLKKK